MRKPLVILFLLLVGSASAQTCITDFLGTKTTYKTPHVKYAPIPKGYSPVFINYVGRHGARHLTKEVNTSFAYTLLFKADSMHALTPAGQKLLRMVALLEKVEKSNVKSISAEGRSELQGIGGRMSNNYSNIFNSDIKLNVAITKEIRTKQSADAFLTGLKSNFKSEAAIKERTDDTNLRFYDASPTYTRFEEDGEWVKSLSALQRSVHAELIYQQFSQKFFKPAFIKILNGGAEKFVTDIFGFATIVYSLKTEIQQAGVAATDVSFISLFNCAELTALSKLDVADDYYKKGPGVNINDIQVRIAAPLLADFVKTSDAFIKTGDFNAQLRFAHAETISPFATLLGISIADKMAASPTGITNVWQASKIIPLSSNIQWVFYKKAGADKYLVKVLLNEKEAHITGLPQAGFPYYNWSDIRQLYITKLQRLNVGLNDDMEAYLKNVK